MPGAPLTLWVRRDGAEYLATAIGWGQVEPTRFPNSGTAARFAADKLKAAQVNLVTMGLPYGLSR